MNDKDKELLIGADSLLSWILHRYILSEDVKKDINDWISEARPYYEGKHD